MWETKTEGDGGSGGNAKEDRRRRFKVSQISWLLDRLRLDNEVPTLRPRDGQGQIDIWSKRPARFTGW